MGANTAAMESAVAGWSREWGGSCVVHIMRCSMGWTAALVLF